MRMVNIMTKLEVGDIVLVESDGNLVTSCGVVVMNPHNKHHTYLIVDVLTNVVRLSATSLEVITSNYNVHLIGRDDINVYL